MPGLPWPEARQRRRLPGLPRDTAALRSECRLLLFLLGFQFQKARHCSRAGAAALQSAHQNLRTYFLPLSNIEQSLGILPALVLRKASPPKLQRGEPANETRIEYWGRPPRSEESIGFEYCFRDRIILAPLMMSKLSLSPGACKSHKMQELGVRRLFISSPRSILQNLMLSSLVTTPLSSMFCTCLHGFRVIGAFNYLLSIVFQGFWIPKLCTSMDIPWMLRV